MIRLLEEIVSRLWNRAERQRAVRAFWSEYFAADGPRPEIQLDGTGMLVTPVSR